MAKSWRPRGWKNSYSHLRHISDGTYYAFEAGADAMLKAVVSWITKGDGDSIPFFIPDVEEEKK